MQRPVRHVRTAHEGRRLDMLEAEVQRLFAELRELFGRVVAAHGMVALGRGEVLSHRENCDARIAQVTRDGEDLLGPPDRVVWIAAGRVQANGHPDSVLEAYRRHRLGLSGRPLDRQPSLAMRVPR